MCSFETQVRQVTWCEDQELNCGLLNRQQALLTTEPPLQYFISFHLIIHLKIFQIMFMSWKTQIRCRHTMLYLWRSKVKFFLSFTFLSFTLLRKGLSSFCHNLGYMAHDFLDLYPSLISLEQCQDYIQVSPHQGFVQVPENELSSSGLHDKRFHHETFPLLFLLIFNSKTQKLKT